MSDREAFGSALNLALACDVTGKPIPEETVSVGNCASKFMRALVATSLFSDEGARAALRVTHRPPSKPSATRRGC